MKVLVVHNAYQRRGGEDVVVENEVALLRSRGHAVRTWIVSNDSIKGWLRKLMAAFAVVFSIRAYRQALAMLREVRPDVVHVHNFFPLLSPSIFYACSRMHIPVILTLHNYRIVCPTATLFIDGRVEERSIAGGPWWAVSHATYRDSYVGTFMLSLMISVHRRIGTWRRKVTRFIALSEGARQRFVDWGIPEARINIKPNFVEAAPRTREPGHEFLYVGRLSREKGLDVLLKAVELGGGSVRVAGDGPLAIERGSHVVPLGPLPKESVEHEMSRARALVVPSVGHEMFGMVVVEAFAQGTPVIASRIGALQSLVDHGVTGLLFDPGDANALCNAMRWAADNPDKMAEMGLRARQKYEKSFSPECNYSQLLAIYQSAIGEVQSGSRAHS